MPRTKLSHLAKRSNISKRWSTSKNDNSKNLPLADITARIQNTNVLKTNTTDYEVMSKRYGEYQQIKFALEEDSAEFRIWYEGHQDVCSATHVGSSGAMEVNAAV
ncbi:uncharacterized protein TNCV_2932731 [Trichonephila clavipes]|nr:uncharacterized protein TNCV_2932731 [Trichonephila clavipes]